jgi:hypothetical protein
MRRGRPTGAEVERLISLAQYWYLSLSLRKDHQALSRWIRSVSDGMDNRSALHFLRHDSAIRNDHAFVLDRHVPGLYRISLWPWRQLGRAFFMSPQQLQTAEESLARSKRQRIDFEDRESIGVNPDFRPITGPLMCSKVDSFFGALLDYRAEQWSRDRNKIQRLSLELVQRLNAALFHPLFNVLKAEITFLALPILFASSCRKSPPELSWRYFEMQQTHDISFDTMPGASRLKSLTRPERSVRKNRTDVGHFE